MPVPLSRFELAQCRQEPLHFFSGVVVHQTDAEHPALLFDSQAFCQIQCVKVSVPGENSAVTDKSCDFGGMVIAQPERQCRTALVKSLVVDDAENLQAGNRE